MNSKGTLLHTRTFGLLRSAVTTRHYLRIYCYCVILEIRASQSHTRNKVHAKIPKGNMGYDQHAVPYTVAVESSLVAFLWHAQTYLYGFLCNSFKFLWRTVNSKPPTRPFGIVACTFSDKLSRNSCIWAGRLCMSLRPRTVHALREIHLTRPKTISADCQSKDRGQGISPSNSEYGPRLLSSLN